MTVAVMSDWARNHGVTLVGGSIIERLEGGGRCSNTSVVFAPDGAICAVYRKIHLFDVDVGGFVYRESEAPEAGAEIAVAEASGWKIGLTICYDLRFPELYRILSLLGAELITVPPLRSRCIPGRTTGSCCSVHARSRTSASWPLPTSGACSPTASRASAAR
jgi:predicted amidohydrolase